MSNHTTTTLTDGLALADSMGDTFRIALTDDGGAIVRTQGARPAVLGVPRVGPLVVLSPEQVAELAALLSGAGK